MLSFLLFTACAGLFAPSDEPGTDDDETTGDEATGERGAASLVTVISDELPMEEDEELPIPDRATLVRVDSCRDDSELGTICENYAGSWTLYDDRLVLSPSAWDNDYARIVWLQVKAAE